MDGIVYDSKLLGFALWKQGKFEAAEKIFQYALSRCRLDKGEQQDKEQLLQYLEDCRKEHLATPTHD
jgi:hypothetical protein